MSVCTAALAAASAAFGADQVYHYRISWNGIPAARAAVIVTEDAAVEPATTHVRAEIRTNSFVDLFWSLRAVASAEVVGGTLQPRHFEFDRRINGRPELTRIEVGPAGVLTARYSRPDRSRLVEVNEANVVDPIAAALRARRQLPIPGQPSTYEIFTGETRYRVELRRAGSEIIRVPAGRFAAARLDPTVWRLDRNVPEPRLRRIALWVTEAAPHTLLRIRSEVFIGAVYCDLTDASGIDTLAEDR